MHLFHLSDPALQESDFQGGKGLGSARLGPGREEGLAGLAFGLRPIREAKPMAT